MISLRLRAGKLPLSTPIGTAQEILERDAKYLSLEGGTEGSAFVVVGDDEPAPEDRGSAWVRVDGAGLFLGVYYWVTDAWVLAQFRPPVGTIIGWSGAWDTVGALYPGFVFADGNNGSVNVLKRMMKSNGDTGDTAPNATSATNLAYGLAQFIG